MSTAAAQAVLLARADLLFTLRDLCSIPVANGSSDALARVEVLADGAAELLQACDIQGDHAELLAKACLLAREVGTDQRGIDIATWDGAATGLDLHEAAYIRRDRGAILGDIAGFYRAFGLQPGGEGQRVDRLGAELEFMGLLYLLQVRGLAAAELEQVAIVAEAQTAFWKDHLRDWCTLPAARAELLPAPEWLATALLAIATCLADLAAAHEWPAPALDDHGEADVLAEAACGMECG